MGKKLKEKINNTVIAFDIETTSDYNSENLKCAWVWNYHFQIERKHFNFRYEKDFFKFLDNIHKELKLEKNEKIIIWVHNLSYEMGFLLGHLAEKYNIKNILGNDKHKLFKVELENIPIIFRCSYLLSGLSLFNTAKIYNLNHGKAIGDLDYSKIRFSETPINSIEMHYITEDTEVVIDFIHYMLSIYKTMSKIPYTKTGIVRRKLKEYVKINGKSEQKKVFKMKIPSVYCFNACKQSFIGGYVHGSFNYIGEHVKNVDSYDITSSYPYVLMTEKFPMSNPFYLGSNKVPNKNMCSISHIIMKDVIVKAEDCYISKSKCMGNSIDIYDYNGRVYKAEQLELWLTNIDIELMKKVYNYTSIKYIESYVWKADYLPIYYRDFISILFDKKRKLKPIKDEKQVEYYQCKADINSLYGMTVTNPLKESMQCDNEGNVMFDDETMEDLLKKYNDNYGRFLYYPWGIFCTAYARRNVWNAILQVKSNYCYCDTDSVKSIHSDNTNTIFNNLNKEVRKKLENTCTDYLEKLGYYDGLCIGEWEHEGLWKDFKTLGAKRYIYTDEKNELNATVAGCPKKSICKAIKKKPYELFDNELYIEPSETGKNTHTYYRDYNKYIIYDKYSKNLELWEFVHLEECEFKMSIDLKLYDMLDDIGEKVVI